MEKRKILLTILMIISVLATDFFVLGSGIKTYALEINSKTSNKNVEFSAYFKVGENRTDNIEKSIKADDVRLYAEIKVKNEGYLKEGTTIEIENSNFNLKNEILSSNKYINSIEGNKVNLKQINNEQVVEIELGIEPIISEKIDSEFLSKTSTVKMNGIYIYSKAEDGETINTEKVVCVNYKPDESVAAELATNIITNKILSVNGTNKRIVQLLIKSRLTNNEYPVKQTTVNATIPQLGEEEPEISVLGINKITNITNTKTENGVVEITLKNEPDENNQINWNQNVYDEIVVTYIYPETVDVSKIEITTNSEISLYNSGNKYTAKYTKGNENKELNKVIMSKTEITTQEIYKGNLYVNAEKQYNTKTSTIITNANVADEIVIHEGPDVLGTADSELAANTKYISTEINLEKMLDILGQDGNIEIKNGENVTVVNKDTENENGKVVINYGNGTSELEITTSKPVKVGILELRHTKAITANSYTRAELQSVKTLKAKNAVSAKLAETEIMANATEKVLELKETVSKAELTIGNNKTTLSATEVNDLTLGITLFTNGEQYDLYKNPKISIKFPEAVENVEVVSTSKQNANEFAVNVGKFNPSQKTLQVSLQGEQTGYPESDITQAHLQLNLKVTLKELALAQTDKLIMTYTNENAIQYVDGRTDAGTIEQRVDISAPSELVTKFNLSSNANKSLTETIVHQIKNNEAGKTQDLEITIINNESSDISDVRIIGKLPTVGNKMGQDENTLETILKGITAPNATTYYTQNTSATVDTQNATNGWTQDLGTIENAKLYLIKLDSLERGESYTATLTVQLPNNINENALSYTQYGVMYDTATENDLKESSRKIGLASSMAATIKTEIKAQVGKDVLESGDIVKEGEVIKYTVTLNNKGAATLENVQLKLDVPEGTTYVQPLENYVYADGYYDEITDSEKLESLTTITIPQLTTTTPYTVEYEVRVNKGAVGTEITNEPTVIYNETQMVNAEFTNIVQASNIRVSIKRQNDEKVLMYAGGTADIGLYIENMTDTVIKNVELQIKSNTLDIKSIVKDNDSFVHGENIPEKIKITEIPANGRVSFSIYGIIAEKVDVMNVFAIVNDTNGYTYRSNMLNQELTYTSATINMNSPQDGKIIQEGDLIEYNIVAKNTGANDSQFNIIGEIAEDLQIQYLYVDGKLIKQSVDSNDKTTYMFIIPNQINEKVILRANEEVNVKIIAKAKYVPDMSNGLVITSNTYIACADLIEDTSKIVTHILKSANGTVENVISGYAWFDKNENGQKDVKEQLLSGVKVKLYDLSTQKYVKDENGIQLKTTTDSNGEYSFSNISNGSYLVIFEYDTEKYVLTTSCAQNVDSSLNSKASIKEITSDGLKIRLAAIELNNLNQNISGINMGLKENKGNTPESEQPGIESLPVEPDEPIDPEDPENPDEPVDLKTIKGLVWLDENINGEKDKEESYLSGIKVRLYNVSTKDYLRDGNGKIYENITNNKGEYEFVNLEKGEYIVIFEYNREEYKLTIQNKNVAVKKINIDGKEIKVAVTDKLNVQEDLSNINIGLQENLKFDLELSKYISKIVVQTNKNTKSYDYDQKTLGKVEIHRKQVQGANVVLEYTIKVKNNGEMAGYATNIVDYVPAGLTFSSELNPDWYISEDNLHTKSLENVQLIPGEEKEIKLILTKVMTNNNVGLINNRAEIYEDYNKYGESDIDSTPNNQNQNEDDFGATDVIIQVATGGSNMTYIILVFINLVLIYVAISIMIKNGIIEIKSKKKGGRV